MVQIEHVDNGAAMRDMLIGGCAHTSAAKRRLWHTRDEVTRLETLLAAAIAKRAEAERDYDESRGLLRESWEFVKDELTAAKAPLEAPL